MIGKKNNKCQLFWYVFVFAFMFLWFTQIHPLVIYDSDDWSFVSFVRSGLPSWKSWNPARVLPETLMPLVCNLSAHLLYPWMGDYMGAITIGCALVVSLFITIYIRCFTKLVERIFSMGVLESTVMSVFFFLLHFLALLSEGSSNQHMFYCWDLTCYFFYLIPSLINASLVMIMTENQKFEEFWESEGNQVKKGLFLLCLYLAVFSNLPASGILAAYAGAGILVALLAQIKSRMPLKSFLKKTGLYAVILVLWLVSAIFELFGGRADSLAQESAGVLQGVKNVLEALSHPTVYSNKVFILAAIFVVVSAIAVCLLGFRKESSNHMISVFFTFMVGGVALLIYMVLLLAVVNWAMVSRAEYLFGLFFYLLIIVMLALCYLLKRYPGGMLVIPLALYVMLTCVNTTGQTFRDSNMKNTPADTWTMIGNDLVNQFIAADVQGLEYFELYVPVSEKDLNWPLFAGYNGFAIGDTLYEHGVTSRRIEFTSVATMEMNEKYHLSITH